MKNMPSLQAFVLAAATLSGVLNGCSKKNSDKMYSTYIINRATYTPKASILLAINNDNSKSIDSAGKIYVKAPYIFVNDVNKGIHVIDNSDPSHPNQIAFLNIPGNIDIAIQGNTLYADMYSDLLALDITDPRHVKVTGDIENFFESRNYVNYVPAILNDGIATSWEQKDTTVEIHIYPTYNPLRPGTTTGPCPNCISYYAGGAYNTLAPGSLNTNSTASSGSKTGTGGSMAAMVILGQNIFALAETHTLINADISNPALPVKGALTYVGYDLETVYPFDDKLFLGSKEGVYIMDVSNPNAPVKLGSFTHGTACDPVITDGKYAYVTLHQGTTCGGDANELQVLNVQDPVNSTLVKTYPMTRPTGLSKDGNLLFVADGPQNVKVFDATDPNNLQLLHELPSGQAYDVITQNNKVIIVSDKGITQYSYDDAGSSFQLLSQIGLGK